MKYLICLLSIFIILKCQQQNSSFNLWISNQNIVNRPQQSIIYKDGLISQYYSDQTFNNNLNCKNGYLQIINNTNDNKLILQYDNLTVINDTNQIFINAEPNQQPHPYVILFKNSIYIIFNCTCNGIDNECQKDNYYNKINVKISQYQFSFLLNCDPNNRHKNFQIGYVFISLITSSIIIGVAMHSHIWSIKINLRPLRVELTWKIFLIISIIAITAVLLVFFLLKQHQLRDVFYIMRYFGIIYSSFFVFVCLNQIFFLIKKLKKEVYKIIRICDTISFAITLAMMIVAFYVQNWIYYNFLAGCICIGSIKLFHFKSLKQAISAMAIQVVFIFILTSVMHFTLPRSYNDYAGELSSPFFLQVPDFINNIYKKCSWLSNIDVVIPGVMLSFLRLYDQNKGSKYGGVYTISGNLAFALSTLLWMSIQLIYPFSVPFSLISNLSLILVIFIISYRRNQWTILFYGTFNQDNEIDNAALQQRPQRFSTHITRDILQQSLVKQQKQSLYQSIGVN